MPKRRRLHGCSGGGVDATGHHARQLQARMGQKAKARVARGIIQRLAACRLYRSQQHRQFRFHQAHVRVSCLEIWNGLGVLARCAAGLSGCAPCRRCRHCHSASIPHAFAPAALRASLASSGSMQAPHAHRSQPGTITEVRSPLLPRAREGAGAARDP